MADGTDFDPYAEAVKKRQELAEKIQGAADENERSTLLDELNGLDAKVKNQLAEQGAKQDQRLKDKLAARRKKRESAIEKEQKMKQDQLQDRVQKALENSQDYQLKKNDLTM